MNPPSCRLQLKVTPAARRNEIVGERDGMIVIKLQAPPTDGRANTALIALLAKRLDIAKGAIALRAGASARRKIVAIQGLAIDEVRRRLLGTT